MNVMREEPKISIVTVVLNDSENFTKTANNISQLNYSNFEYIVIDGESTDGTKIVIESLRSIIDIIISEKDFGLYDAMNKGIEAASGDWIVFMNAGDQFASNDTLNLIFDNSNFKGFDILYGDAILSYPKFKVNEPAGNFFDLNEGMQFCHQSVFIGLDYHKKNRYNISNKFCADFEFFYNAFLNQINFLKLEHTISNVLPNGISGTNREIVYLSWWQTVGYADIKLNIHYAIKILSAILKRIAKFFLPERIIHLIIKFKKSSRIIG